MLSPMAEAAATVEDRVLAAFAAEYEALAGMPEGERRALAERNAELELSRFSSTPRFGCISVKFTKPLPNNKGIKRKRRGREPMRLPADAAKMLKAIGNEAKRIYGLSVAELRWRSGARIGEREACVKRFICGALRQVLFRQEAALVLGVSQNAVDDWSSSRKGGPGVATAAVRGEAFGRRLAKKRRTAF